MTRLLTVEHLFAGYDRADVLSDISMVVDSGRITCILGANGAGKTTLIRAILGLTPPRQGKVAFAGLDLAGFKTHQIVALGVGVIPEGRRIFGRMTVEENLRVGAYRNPSAHAIAAELDRVYQLFPRLKERARQLAGTMSGGEQAMVSIGRGLMTAPKLLIIDEPSLGLSPKLVQDNFDIIRQIAASGVSVLLVEQNVNQTLAIAQYGYVLAQGRVVAAGPPDVLRQDEEVRRAYFGAGA